MRSRAASRTPTSSTGGCPTRCCSSSSPTRGSGQSCGPRLVTLADLVALERQAVMPTYARLPVEFVRGEGTRLWDAGGHEYLDFLAGVAAVQIGHCHPALVEAIAEQAGRA